MHEKGPHPGPAVLGVAGTGCDRFRYSSPRPARSRVADYSIRRAAVLGSARYRRRRRSVGTHDREAQPHSGIDLRQLRRLHRLCRWRRGRFGWLARYGLRRRKGLHSSTFDSFRRTAPASEGAPRHPRWESCDRHQKKSESTRPLIRANTDHRVGSNASAPPPRADLMRASANSPPSPRPALMSGPGAISRGIRDSHEESVSATLPGAHFTTTIAAMVRDLEYYRLIRSMS